MSLASGIYDFLSDELGHTRVFPLTLPQGVQLPAHTYQLVSAVPLHTHSTAQDSTTHADGELTTSRVQVASYAGSYLEMEEADADIVRLLNGYRGAFGDIRIGSALTDIALDDYEPDTRLWRRVRDFMIRHTTGGAS